MSSLKTLQCLFGNTASFRLKNYEYFFQTLQSFLNKAIFANNCLS